MEYIWYVGYASNLCWERFECYIIGGKPTGGNRHNPGCRNQEPPLLKTAIRIPYPMYFARNSQQWNGGIAFIDHERNVVKCTLARGYLITRQQFDDVVAQENSLGRGTYSVDIESIIQKGNGDLSKGLYSRIVYLGHKDDYPMLTFTSPKPMNSEVISEPSKAYLGVIWKGLRESYPDLSREELLHYLNGLPGVTPFESLDDLIIRLGL
ncbi:hypothetical protein GTO91_10330 [Heliobacterium undosum]|uniref:Gamma-glutamylcyclotransferase n=1 Tax=Heliomicrobium undosum TaxID=121734 RepID=A0A845L1L0_9FIRM|nr:hypothetical protein [Heliomicrobium undosum]MZP30103.1 hypothetical protein [Heliomicrobium undosum]